MRACANPPSGAEFTASFRRLLMLIKHSILYTIAKLVPGLLSIATTGILTHLFDPTQYGVYALVILVMTLTANIGFDWLGVSFLRFYDSTKGDPRTIATYFHIFSGLMVVSAIVGLYLI